MTIEVNRIPAAPLDPRAEQSMVAMRDGTRLATDVYLPADRTVRWPVVLVRLPYDKSGRYTFMPLLAPHVTDRGYAFVVQDVRGKFRSEGETVPFVHEVEDGYDTLDWLAAQRWSDGRVVMFGDSYYGFTQWAAVASGHPALRAIVPRVTSADLAIFNWSGEGVTSLYGADYLAHYWVDNPIYDYAVDWRHRPLSEAFDEAFRSIGARSRGFDVLVQHQTRGAPQLEPYPSGHPFERLAIPVLHAIGWFDNLSPDAMRDYVTLTARSASAPWQYLIADSADHENYRLDDVPFAPEDLHDENDLTIERLIPLYLGPALEFYDTVLRDRTTPRARVRWHLGNVGWRESASWPPGTRPMRLFLARANDAPKDPDRENGGLLTDRADAISTAARWIHDPGNLVPSTVEDPFSFLFEYPDERQVESRGDVLVFTGEPAQEALDLIGPVTAALRVATTGPSMHLFIKLVDVSPDGSAHQLARAQTTVSRPDGDTPVELNLNHLAYRLLPGHRLRLQIASSDFPLYLPHPGIAENPWLAIDTALNEQTLITGSETSSFLVLGVLEGGSEGPRDRGGSETTS